VLRFVLSAAGDRVREAKTSELPVHGRGLGTATICQRADCTWMCLSGKRMFFAHEHKENTKFEIPNSKQFSMIKNKNRKPNKRGSDLDSGIFSFFGLFRIAMPLP
jgi:hypothetical protein